MLLILSGVAVVTLTGENGILERARLAKEKTQQKTAEEQVILNSYENEIDKNLNNTRSTVTISQEEYNDLQNVKEYYYNQYNYSNEEKIIGKLNDNSTLYQKSWNIASLTRTTEGMMIDSTFNNQNKNIIKIEGMFTDEYGSFCVFPYASPANGFLAAAYISNNGLIFAMGSNLSSVTNLRITVIYTRN